MSESTQDRPDQPEQADEQAPKPGEQDTETVAGQPKKAPGSGDGEQAPKPGEQDTKTVAGQPKKAPEAKQDQ